MIARSYEALLLDLDGTLVGDDESIHPRTRKRLQELSARGVIVMLATGRSAAGTLAVIEELELETPAVVFNGAGIYCPLEGRMIEERLLADAAVERALAFASRRSLLPVVMRSGEKLGAPPANEAERSAMAFLEGLSIVERDALPTDFVIRVTLFSAVHPDSDALGRELEVAVRSPAYVTHFPLRALPQHRASELLVADLQPPCRGKGEALRFLEERYGIPRERVVAVGDAANDVPMMRAAGLPVAMENSVSEALAAARRVIGSNNSDAIARLVEELWGL